MIKSSVIIYIFSKMEIILKKPVKNTSPTVIKTIVIIF